MKKSIIFLTLVALASFSLQAQNGGHGHHQNHNNDNCAPMPQIIGYAMTEDGKRIILFDDGTWKFARRQEPVRPMFTSEIFGQQLIIQDRNEEVARVKMEYETAWDLPTHKLIGAVSFGNATYVFDAKGDIRFQGNEVIGRADRFEEAQQAAAYHYTNKVFDGVTSVFFGSSLIVYEWGKEIDRVSVSYNTWLEDHGKTWRARYSFGTATYNFNGKDGAVRSYDFKVIGHGFQPDNAKRIAAFHYVESHYDRQGWAGR
ncbi:MAG: hypothetical protein IPN76_32975 [Saprospiraceae bacterium]|nr:hypothetical protein [Saprospiraceae bacterium]